MLVFGNTIYLEIQSFAEAFMTKLAGVVEQLKEEREQTRKMLEQLDTAIRVLGGWASSGSIGRPRRKLSAAGRKRIAAAQRARWAKVRRKKKTH